MCVSLTVLSVLNKETHESL